MSSTAVFTFGRMNPPTIGHEKLVNKITDIANLIDAKPLVYLSHKQDSKSNPLSYLSKMFIAKQAFGDVMKLSEANTIISVLQELEHHYDNIMLVVGSDRVDEFETLLHKYNSKEYKFKSIMVVSAGDRDPDSSDVDGMSASKMRALAEIGDIESFEAGLPTNAQSLCELVMNEIRKGMNV